MKTLVGLLIALTVASPALATTDAELMQRQYKAQHWCQIPEDAPDVAASDKACADSKALSAWLAEKGYCYDRSEQEWVACRVPKLTVRN
jgi:hypothetical protein